MGNHAARFVSICSPAPAAFLSQPCPRRFWPTLGSWLLPQRCTCWARLGAGTLCRPGPDYTAACREGTHPQSKETQNKQTEGGKKHVFSLLMYIKICVNVWKAALCGSYGKRLRVDPHCLMLSPQVEQKVLQGVKVVQVADGSIDHKHHLESQIDAQHRPQIV